MAQIPQIDTELLLKAFSRPSLGQTLQAGTQGFGTGVDLGTRLAQEKSRRQKEEMDLMKEIQKLTAQKKLVSEAQTPIPTTKDVQTPISAISPVELPSGEMVASEGPAKQIKSALFTKPQDLTPEEMVKEEAMKKQRLTGLAAEADPETFAKKTLENQLGSATESKRFQQGTAEIGGKILNVVFDQVSGTYKYPDGTPIKEKLVRGFKPDIRVDPTTEQLIRLTTGGVTTPIGGTGIQQQEVQFPEDLTVRQSNRLNELSKRFEDDEIVKSARISMSTLQNLKTVQAQGTGALIGSLQSLRARGLAGEKGVLTEADVARTTGSPQLTRRFMNALTKLALGQENPENIAEFNAALDAVEQAAATRSQQVENQFIKRAKNTKELNNVSEDLLRQNISIGTTPFTPVEAKTKETGLTPDKKARLEELRAKKAAGTLR